VDHTEPRLVVFFTRARHGIARRVHDQRLQTRLQIGASLGLAVGLIVSVAFLSNSLDPLNSILSFFLFRPYPPPDHPILVEQDPLAQIVTIFLMALLVGGTVPHVRFLPGAGLTILYFVAYLQSAYFRFSEGLIVRPLYSALALILSFICTTAAAYLSEGRHRVFLSRLFKRYVSPERVEAVVESVDNNAPPLVGTHRQVSVLCVDMRDFNTLIGVLDPEALMRMVNDYNTRVVSNVFQHAGSIVEQSGKAIIAAWNLPLEQVDHAHLAVAAAVKIRKELKDLVAKLPKEHVVNVGMGIATGDVVAGHIGGPNRPDYTLVGEVVWLAERLAIKPDHSIYIDAATFWKVNGEFETREVNPIQLRRKTDPARAWQVCEDLQSKEPS
jgi:class 3 adenylate cyclase